MYLMSTCLSLPSPNRDAMAIPADELDFIRTLTVTPTPSSVSIVCASNPSSIFSSTGDRAQFTCANSCIPSAGDDHAAPILPFPSSPFPVAVGRSQWRLPGRRHAELSRTWMLRISCTTAHLVLTSSSRTAMLEQTRGQKYASAPLPSHTS